jgi:predicted glycoside hydrolase/deacetylase ChbG (UPF0249 family)
MIIINSDDFGYSPDVNKAIYNSLQQKLISSTTTLVNFTEGFEDALKYTNTGLIDLNSIGIHFNLTEGVPLTNAIKSNPLFSTNGQFSGNIRKSSMFVLDGSSKQMVYEELKAQLLKFMKGFSQKPTHFDSHHHVHTEWAIGSIIAQLGKEFGIKKIRIARNSGEENNFSKKVYRRLYNLQRKINGFNTVSYFGDIEDMKNINFLPQKTYEIMVHAKYLEDNMSEIVDMDGANLKNKVDMLFGKDMPLLSSYDSI